MKNYFLFAIVVASLFAVSCEKDPVKSIEAKTENVSFDSKTSFVDNNIVWSDNDTICVYATKDKPKKEYAATYKLKNDGGGSTSGSFEYLSGEMVSENDKAKNWHYTAVYPASMSVAADSVRLPAVQHSVDGRLQGMPMYAISDNTELNFYHLCGVVRFQLSASGVSISRIAAIANSNINGVAAIKGQESSLSLDKLRGSKVTTLALDEAQNITTARDFFMYLPTGTYKPFTVLVTAADGSVCKATVADSVKVERGKVTTVTLRSMTFNKYHFSVADASTVLFAPGNLQYIGDKDEPYWRFASRHTDYMGNNRQATNSETVERDLFGWGTSGYDDKHAPWQTSTDDAVYYLDDSHTNMTGEYAKADWGVYNAIRNYGNTPGQWRTLSHDEWVYLLHARNTDRLFAKAKVDGTAGLVIFPDRYSHPRGVTTLKNVNADNALFTDNVFTASEWALMEAEGAVFLPAAGYRRGTTVYYVGEYGQYWSSTVNTDHDAYGIFFAPGFTDPQSKEYRSNGCAVRLVRD